MNRKTASAPDCEHCLYNTYDEEYGEYYCQFMSYLDEDELSRLYRSKGCQYFRAGDEYTIVRKQI